MKESRWECQCGTEGKMRGNLVSHVRTVQSHCTAVLSMLCVPPTVNRPCCAAAASLVNKRETGVRLRRLVRSHRPCRAPLGIGIRVRLKILSSTDCIIDHDSDRRRTVHVFLIIRVLRLPHSILTQFVALTTTTVCTQRVLQPHAVTP